MRRRIAFCLGLLLTMVVFGDAAAVIALNQSIGVLSTLVDAHRIQSMREHLTAAGQRVRANQLAALAGLAVEESTRLEAQARLRASVTKCNSCHHEDPIQSELDRIGAMMETYLSQLNQPRSSEGQLSRTVNESGVVELGERFVDQITATADRASRHLTVHSEQAISRVSNARFMLFAALAVALVLGLAGAVHLQQRLTRPIRSILGGISRLRAGEHDYRLPLTGDTEFQEVARAFNDAYVELQRSQQAVVHAERLAAVGQLASGVAHEVLNPMASISSVVQILRSHSDDPQYVGKTNLIMKEIDRVTKIVRDLEAFSRPQEKEPPTDVDLHTALEHVIELVSYDERAKNVMIKQDFAANNAVVRGHVDRLLIVLTNTLFNALDAASNPSDGRGEIAVSTRTQGKNVEVCVHDNGPGMTDEQIALAFEPFFTTKPPGAGTGLGLWTCYRIVERLGGSMMIQSPRGGGTLLTLRLPSCETDVASTSTP